MREEGEMSGERGEMIYERRGRIGEMGDGERGEGRRDMRDGIWGDER